MVGGYNLSVTTSITSADFRANCVAAIDKVIASCVSGSQFLGGKYTHSDMKLSLLDNNYPNDPVLVIQSSSASLSLQSHTSSSFSTSRSISSSSTQSSSPGSVSATFSSSSSSTSLPSASITSAPVTTTSGGGVITGPGSSSTSSVPFAVVSGSVKNVDSAVVALQSSTQPKEDSHHVKDLIDDAEDVAILAGFAYLASLLTSASAEVTAYIAGTTSIEAVAAAWATAMAAEAELENEQNNSQKPTTKGDSTKSHSSASQSSSKSSSTSSSSSSSSSISRQTETQSAIYNPPDPTNIAAYRSVAAAIWKGKITDYSAVSTASRSSLQSVSSTLSSSFTSSTSSGSSSSLSSSTPSGFVTSVASTTSSIVSSSSSSQPSSSASGIASSTSLSHTSSSSSAISSSQITSSPSSSSTSAHVPWAHTVTSNGMICVLIEGSTDPQCRPESTPTPNPAGTNIHVNTGCININGSPRCASGTPYESSYNVASQNQPYSTTPIYAGFDATDVFSENVTPGCLLSARWPANYGDVYFGDDNCLHDSSGAVIYNQCCAAGAEAAAASVANPYRSPLPAASCERDNAILYIKFRIWSKDWVKDGGAALRHQVSGCGALTGWYQSDSTDHKGDGSGNNIGQYQADDYVSFNLPTTFKTGCVGRAIKSAGGPDGVKC
ncbi:hypothetical protein BU16DRAFT_618860 [Lophium mytilinum]|uniref:Uncharacterized protein n=1 Tax=Lophium mytilinum TaxID=390894 RepID=A0A6A6QRY0_9PEZI|nr:hypothetical protein BU16DRAFT_618860 [Lophium mytilinum]